MKKITLLTLLCLILLVGLVFASEWAAISNWDTSGQSGDPRSITNNDTFIWIIDGAADQVYKYFASNGTYTGDNWDTSVEVSDSRSLTTNSTFIWVLDLINDDVERYYMNGTYSGNAFSIPEASQEATGITNNNTFFWIVEQTADETEQYYMNGTHVAGFATTAGGATPRGITTNGTFIWIEYDGQIIGKFFGGNGTYTGNATSIAGPSAGQGITTNTSYYWVVGNSNDEVYQFEGIFVAAPIGTPIIVLNNPSDEFVSNVVKILFNKTITPDTFNVTNETTSIWYNNGSLFNETTITLTGNESNTSAFNVSAFVLGNYIWNSLGCQGDGNGINCSYGDAGNFTFTVGSSVDSETHSAVVWETIKETFTIVINLLTGAEISLAQLVYNNTNYTISNISTSGSEITLSTTIDVPLNALALANQTNNFFYRFTYEGDTIQETSNYTQNVSFINLQLCNATYFTESLNFTITDESTQTKIDASANTIDFQTTFNYWLGAGEVFKNRSFSELGNVTNSSFQFCISPFNESMITNMTALYDAVDYSEREYNLANASISNETSDITLFLLNDSAAVKFTFTVKEGTVNLQGAFITISKFFVGDGIYRTISIRKTDDSGEFVEHLELDRDYRYSIVKDGVLRAVIDRRSSCSAAPCEETLQISEAQGSVWTPFDEVWASSVLSNLSINKTTKVVTYEFIDTTGLAQHFRLQVSRGFLNETSDIICNEFSFTSSGSMTCNLTGYDGDFVATGFISRSPEKIDRFISFFLGALKDSLGVLALFISIALIVTLVFAGVSISGGNPSVVLFFFGLSVLILKLMTLFPYSWSLVALIELVTIFLMKVVRT